MNVETTPVKNVNADAQADKKEIVRKIKEGDILHFNYKGEKKTIYVTPDPVTQWTEVKDIDANLEIGIECYAHMLKWFTENPTSEIAGWGSISEDNMLDWVIHTSTGTSGSVDVTDSQMANAIERAAESDKSLSLHWHTHPGMEAYWSRTDNNMQDKLAKMTQENDWTYIVYNGMSWVTRRVIRTEGNIYYNSGTVTLKGASIPLPNDFSMWDTTQWYKHGDTWYESHYSQYNYGQSKYKNGIYPYLNKKEPSKTKDVPTYDKEWAPFIIDIFEDGDLDFAADCLSLATTEELAELAEERPDIIETLSNYLDAMTEPEELVNKNKIDSLIIAYINGNYQESVELYRELSESELEVLEKENYDVKSEMDDIMRILEEHRWTT